MLFRANGDLLQRGYRIGVESAFRHPSEQLYWRQYWYEELKRANPDMEEKHLLDLRDAYAAPLEGPNASAHLTGAALDISMYEAKTLTPVQLDSPDLGDFENAIPLNPLLPDHILRQRYLLLNTLIAHGFINRHNEMWHISYGDQYWAQATGKNPIYGVYPYSIKPIHSFKKTEKHTDRIAKGHIKVLSRQNPNLLFV